MNNKQGVSISHNKDHTDLIEIKDFIYKKCGFSFSNQIKEEESAEYGGYFFDLNPLSVRFRVAKITPTKVGQFVTLWKRVGNLPIQPFDMSDKIDFFIVSVRNDHDFGQFVFPKSALLQHGILSKNGIGGKRAIRVYPPWDVTTSHQAKNTQLWQLKYFLEIPKNSSIDFVRAKMLYGQK